MHRILKKDLGIVNLDTQWEVRRVAELHSPTTNGGRLVSIEMPKHIGEIVGSDLAIVIGESNQSAACILHPSVASSPQTGTALFHKPNGSGADRSHVETRSCVLSEGPLSTTTN